MQLLMSIMITAMKSVFRVEIPSEISAAVQLRHTVFIQTYQDSMAVNNNNIGGGTGSTSTSYGIYIYYGYNSSVLVYNNTVSDTTATTSSSTYGIAVYYAGNTGVDNTVTVKRNTVQGMTNTAAATSAALYGYYIYYTISL